MIDYGNFTKALKNLETYNRYYQSQNGIAQMPDEEKALIEMGMVKSYEICWDTLIKVLKRYLSEEIGIADEFLQGPKLFIKQASASSLLSSDGEQFIKYLNARNSSAHRYSMEEKEEIQQIIPGFIDDAIGLWQTMTGQSWD